MMDGGGNVSGDLQSLTEYDKLGKLDGFVKSPSAALHFSPAPLDKKLHSWDAGIKLLIFEGKTPFEKYLTG
jgi:hypothetical protein